VPALLVPLAARAVPPAPPVRAPPSGSMLWAPAGGLPGCRTPVGAAPAHLRGPLVRADAGWSAAPRRCAGLLAAPPRCSRAPAQLPPLLPAPTPVCGLGRGCAFASGRPPAAALCAPPPVAARAGIPRRRGPSRLPGGRPSSPASAALLCFCGRSLAAGGCSPRAAPAAGWSLALPRWGWCPLPLPPGATGLRCASGPGRPCLAAVRAGRELARWRLRTGPPPPPRACAPCHRPFRCTASAPASPGWFVRCGSRCGAGFALPVDLRSLAAFPTRCASSGRPAAPPGLRRFRVPAAPFLPRQAPAALADRHGLLAAPGLPPPRPLGPRPGLLRPAPAAPAWRPSPAFGVPAVPCARRARAPVSRPPLQCTRRRRRSSSAALTGEVPRLFGAVLAGAAWRWAGWCAGVAAARWVVLPASCSPRRLVGRAAPSPLAPVVRMIPALPASSRRLRTHAARARPPPAPVAPQVCNAPPPPGCARCRSCAPSWACFLSFWCVPRCRASRRRRLVLVAASPSCFPALWYCRAAPRPAPRPATSAGPPRLLHRPGALRRLGPLAHSPAPGLGPAASTAPPLLACPLSRGWGLVAPPAAGAWRPPGVSLRGWCLARRAGASIRCWGGPAGRRPRALRPCAGAGVPPRALSWAPSDWARRSGPRFALQAATPSRGPLRAGSRRLFRAPPQRAPRPSGSPAALADARLPAPARAASARRTAAVASARVFACSPSGAFGLLVGFRAPPASSSCCRPRIGFGGRGRVGAPARSAAAAPRPLLRPPPARGRDRAAGLGIAPVPPFRPDRPRRGALRPPRACGAPGPAALLPLGWRVWAPLPAAFPFRPGSRCPAVCCARSPARCAGRSGCCATSWGPPVLPAAAARPARAPPASFAPPPSSPRSATRSSARRVAPPPARAPARAARRARAAAGCGPRFSLPCLPPGFVAAARPSRRYSRGTAVAGQLRVVCVASPPLSAPRPSSRAALLGGLRLREPLLVGLRPLPRRRGGWRRCGGPPPPVPGPARAPSGASRAIFRHGRWGPGLALALGLPPGASGCCGLVASLAPLAPLRPAPPARGEFASVAGACARRRQLAPCVGPAVPCLARAAWRVAACRVARLVGDLSPPPAARPRTRLPRASRLARSRPPSAALLRGLRGGSLSFAGGLARRRLPPSAPSPCRCACGLWWPGGPIPRRRPPACASACKARSRSRALASACLLRFAAQLLLRLVPGPGPGWGLAGPRLLPRLAGGGVGARPPRPVLVARPHRCLFAGAWRVGGAVFVPPPAALPLPSPASLLAGLAAAGPAGRRWGCWGHRPAAAGAFCGPLLLGCSACLLGTARVVLPLVGAVAPPGRRGTPGCWIATPAFRCGRLLVRTVVSPRRSPPRGGGTSGFPWASPRRHRVAPAPRRAQPGGAPRAAPVARAWRVLAPCAGPRGRGRAPCAGRRPAAAAVRARPRRWLCAALPVWPCSTPRLPASAPCGGFRPPVRWVPSRRSAGPGSRAASGPRPAAGLGRPPAAGAGGALGPRCSRR